MSLDRRCKNCKKEHNGLFIFACFAGCTVDNCDIAICDSCILNDKEIDMLQKLGHDLISD